MSEPERKLKVSDGQISPPGLDQEPDDHETKIGTIPYAKIKTHFDHFTHSRKEESYESRRNGYYDASYGYYNCDSNAYDKPTRTQQTFE
ncbi:hypothetical protein RUM43_008216 [Polyplax serrata]|uniref:Uncharacterized protein n=1 Tax=Polyplax serrata TaxID=468196 RepID=A0AAN8P2V6_POLSC